MIALCILCGLIGALIGIVLYDLGVINGRDE